MNLVFPAKNVTHDNEIGFVAVDGESVESQVLRQQSLAVLLDHILQRRESTNRDENMK
jgi:hypothetical protein